MENQFKLIVRQDDWSERLRLKAEISARTKRVQELESSMGFEKGEIYAYQFGLKEGDSFSFTVENGNGNYCGKVSVSWRAPEENPRSGFFMVRIS